MVDILAWLKIAVEKKASDLHLSSGLTPMVRLDGQLRSIATEVLEKSALLEGLKSLMPWGVNKKFLDELESDFVFSIPALARFRVNCFYQWRGPSAVFRVIPEAIPSLQDLNAPAIFKKLCHLSHGLILITGPTGSGKSTTLAAMVQYINTQLNKHILTIESPIEFVHPCDNSIIQQREVGEHTQDYHQALRAALRQDPDVIVMGEMRDLDAMRLALTAAETGHLVVSTLHTHSAIDAIDRMIGVFHGDEQSRIRQMLSLSLQAVIAQTLLCKKEGGRVAAYEVMVANAAVRNLIRENKSHQITSIIQTSQAEGMVSRAQYLQQLTAQGVFIS